MSKGLVITIPGNPGAARINGAWRAKIFNTPNGPKPATRPSPKFKRWRAAAKTIVRAAWRVAGQSGPIVGPVSLEIRAYWPRMRRVGPAAGQPLGDVDAVAKAVLDVLDDASVRVLGDDGQVRELLLVSEYDRERPRIEILFGCCSDLVRLRADHARLLADLQRLADATGYHRNICPNGSIADRVEAAIDDLKRRAAAT